MQAKLPFRKVAEADFPTRWGSFRIMGFEARSAGKSSPDTALALVMGDISGSPPLLRIHSQCLTGDVFGSLRCDCRQQLEKALETISTAGAGIIIYEQQEGRGIGLMAKLRAYELQDQGRDTIEANEELGFSADCRDYDIPVKILQALGISQVRLMSNSPQKIAALRHAAIEILERIPCEGEPAAQSAAYLKTKRDRLGHFLSK